MGYRGKGICVLLALLLTVGLVGCGEQTESARTIAVVTDGGSLQDGAYNQAVYEGVRDWCKEAGYEVACYEPEGSAAEDLYDSMDQAYEDGVRVIVVAGSSFEQPVYEIQSQRSSLQILLLDGEPHGIDYNYETAENVHCVLFQEEQAGFLAGYAAVVEGYRSLGFVGGVELTGVIQYLYGFLQGADQAAYELRLEKGDVTVRYTYSDTFDASDSVADTCEAWYGKGVGAIFSACGNGLENVLSAAASGNGLVTLSDFSRQDDRVFTSAVKRFDTAIALALDSLEKNDWEWSAAAAGQTSTVGLAEGCVGLDVTEDAWPFTGMSYADYTLLVQDIVDGYIAISDSISQEPTLQVVTASES
ncbi:MAG: BMP family ABC transporter substrate-binding protein [Clostridiales bacterium]|nr:BMP family ABC transporter substrate-binding protein [Clostridiales bacterium]